MPEARDDTITWIVEQTCRAVLRIPEDVPLPASITSKEAARVLGVTPDTLRWWRHAGRGPRFLRLGGGPVRYLPADLAAYLENHTEEPTS